MSEAAGPAEEILPELTRALMDAGANILDAAEAVTEFEARASRPPVSATATDHDTVQREAQTALYFAALRRGADTRRAAEEVLEAAESVLESLNRERSSARDVLDACLYFVRSWFDAGNVEAARARVLECRRLVVDLQPDAAEHPPSVLNLLRDAEAELANHPNGALRVESAPDRCPAFLNGRPVGETPLVLDRLPRGSYRVQVDCPGRTPGRVHAIELATEPITVRVDARFDGTVRATPALALMYPSAGEAEAHRIEDAAVIGRVLEGGHLVLLTSLDDGRARIEWIRISDGRVAGLAVFPLTDDRRDNRTLVQAAAEALRQGEHIELTVGDVRALLDRGVMPSASSTTVRGSTAGPEAGTAGATPTAASSPEDPARSERTTGRGREGTTAATASRRSLARSLAGWTAAITGTLGLAASGYSAWRLSEESDRFASMLPTEDGYLAAQTRIDNAEGALFLTGSIGGGLATLAVPLLLPETDGVPWWAMGAGAAGAGLAATSVVYFTTPTECIDGYCIRKIPNAAYGTLLLGHAAPLLAVPLTCLLRAWLWRSAPASRASASITLTRGAPLVEIGGSF